MDRSTPGFPVLHCLPEFAQVHVHCVSDASQPPHPLPPLLLFPSIFPIIQVFSNELALWSGGQSIGALASVLPMNIQLLSFRIDWFDFPAVPGIFKSLLQHCILKAPVLQCSAFLMVQLSHPHMATGKITVLTIQTFVKRCRCFLILCPALSPLFSQEANTWFHGCSHGPWWSRSRRKESLSLPLFVPFFLPWSDGTRGHDLSFLNVEF